MNHFTLTNRYQRELLVGEYFEGILNYYFVDNLKDRYIDSTFQYKIRGVVPQIHNHSKNINKADITIFKGATIERMIEVKYKNKWIQGYREDRSELETGIDSGDLYYYTNLADIYNIYLFFIHEGEKPGVYYINVNDIVEDYRSIKEGEQNERCRRTKMRQGSNWVDMFMFNRKHLKKLCTIETLYSYENKLLNEYPRVVQDYKSGLQ
jgi:hypothetical protein